MSTLDLLLPQPLIEEESNRAAYEFSDTRSEEELIRIDEIASRNAFQRLQKLMNRERKHPDGRQGSLDR